MHIEKNVENEQILERIGDTGVIILKNENGYYNIVIGRYRLRENHETREEALKRINSIDLEFISCYIAVIHEILTSKTEQ